MNRRWLLTGLLSLAGVQPCLAQQEAIFVTSSQVPVSCLTSPPQAAPAYPRTAADGPGGVVRLLMVFSDPTSPSKVKVFTNTAGEAFEAAVLAHVEKYRLSCFRADGREVTLIQEFQFVAKHDRAVLPGALRFYRRKPTCKYVFAPSPPYPSRSMMTTQLNPTPTSGTVLVALAFTAGQEAPRVQVLHDGAWSRFAQTARTHAAETRVKCDDDAEFPMVGVMPYKFRMEGDPEFRPEPVSLMDFLAVVDQLEGSRLYFDFNTMGCPFDFSIFPMQPDFPNVTNWSSSPMEDRREFLAWLTGVKLKLPRKLLSDLRGNALKVHVPCVVMNFL